MNALDIGSAPSNAIRPSPAFFAVLAAVAVGAWLSVNATLAPGIAVFIFVLAGWILSLIFHEFAHAVVAWRGGDRSIPSKGYLTLDPRRYADPLTSIALPLFFLIAGGIALPGGAVWINRAAIRSRTTASLVSLAGPATNLVFAAVCLVPLSIGLIDAQTQPVLAAGLGFLGFLQVLAFVLNMLPVPGLDGFGAIEPFLPHSVLTALAPIRRWGFVILIVVLFTVDPARDLFWAVIESILDAFGVDQTISNQDLSSAGFDPEFPNNIRFEGQPANEWPLRSAGWELFRFWD